MATVHGLDAYRSTMPEFPTPLERKLLDLPAFPEEDDFFIPDLFNSRAATASRPSRDGADAVTPPRDRSRPHKFIDMTEPFKDALAVACIIIVLFITLAVLP